MKNILRGSIFITSIFVWMFFIVIPQYNTEYNAAMIDKYERLMSIDEPKIILVGDSNVTFGFNSEKIEKAIGMPVVNLGLNLGLGQAFHSEVAKANMNSGDIIVLAPTSHIGETDTDGVGILVTIENYIPLWKTLNKEHFNSAIEGFPVYFKKVLTLWRLNEGNKQYDNPTYAVRASFNKYGDVEYPRPNNIMVNGYEDIELFSQKMIYNAMIEYWNEYNKYAIDKGTNLLMAAFPIMQPNLKITHGELLEYQNELKTLLDFPLISDFDDYIYPPEYFYNSSFHLNDYGKEIRTDMLIKDLENYLANPAKY